MAEQLIHLGIIPDGDRRWARERHLPTIEGHRRGADKTKLIVDMLKDSEVKFITFFVFSTENWNRSPEEVDYLMHLIGDAIESIHKQAQKDNLRLLIMGRPAQVDPELWQKLTEIEVATQANTGLTVCFCFNYGGLQEIVDAAQRMAAAGDTDYTPEHFRAYLYHPEVPDCDLIVRTSGEQRLSGFQLWRAAYAELLFLDKYFPSIEAADIQAILDAYHQRQRRFGK